MEVGFFYSSQEMKILRLKNYLPAVLLLVLWGCGHDEKEEDTPYGSAEEVRQYRERINPLIDELNAIEMEVQETAVGTSGQATAANLAAACERLCERLRAVLAEIEAIEPPPLLAPLHGDVRRLVLLRLEAYTAVLEELEAEVEAAFDQAEEQLRQANALAAELNGELEEVDRVLASAKRSQILHD